MDDKIYLVDGSGYIFRAYYAVAPLTTRAGFPTNALFGFVRMLKKLISDAGSEYLAVAFDAGRETFRLSMYPRYKANRAECPQDLLVQMPFFRELSRALGLQILELPGYEADDVIGTLAVRLASHGRDVVIVSGDKDFMQLVSPQITIWDTLHDRRFGEAEVQQKFGVCPDKVVEVLGLIGDSSDNIPGVDGVGPKTAAQLIDKFGTVEGVISSLGTLREDSTIRNRKKIAQEIELNVGLVRLSRKLVEIDRRAPVVIQDQVNAVNIDALADESLLHALKRGQPRHELLRNLAERFEFSSLLEGLGTGAGEFVTQLGRSAGAVECRMISASDFASWLEEFRSQKEFAFDIETTSLNVLEAEVVGISFCWNDRAAFYVPLSHRDCQSQISLSDFWSGVGAAFADPDVKKTGQNLKYDLAVLYRHGVPVEGVSFDAMIAAYLLNPDKGSYNLTTLASDYLGRGIVEYEEALGDAADFSGVDVARATEYACQDAQYAWLLKKALQPNIVAQDLGRVLDEIEMPLVPVLARMELKGVCLDEERLAVMSAEFAESLERIRTEIYELAGCEFNINSPKQLAEILFDKLGISTKGIRRTKTGISTDAAVLEKLSEDHPLPAHLLRYRMLHKLKSTYIDALPVQVSPVSRRLHSRLNQTGTGTGRLSSSEPNLQNIPIQTPEGRKIREAFIASPGKVLISADYSQIELRLLAHMSGDANMIAAFRGDLDIHAGTARELMGLDSGAKVSPEQRRLGKTINFGIVYGMGGYRLSRELGIPLAAANSYIEGYFRHYPGVRNFFNELEVRAQEEGFVRTLFGRKRVLEGIDASGRDRGFVVRAALNAPIQGSAADVIKCAMIRIDRLIRAKNLPIAMILQIHDELLFECDEHFCNDAAHIITAEMERVVDLKVPLKVDVGMGHNWGEAHR